MGGQLVTVGVGMSIMPGREDWLFLRVMWRVRMRRIKGMMLIHFTVPILIRAGLRTGLGGLWIIFLAIGSPSWRHSH